MSDNEPSTIDMPVIRPEPLRVPLEDLMEFEPDRRPRHRKPQPARSPVMYWIIVILWALLCVPMGLAARFPVEAALNRNPFLAAGVISTAVLIAVFWLNGMKDLIYPVAYRVSGWQRRWVPPRAGDGQPLVGLLYATCNDFSEPALAASVRQDYPRCAVFILDDSSQQWYKDEVDRYASEHGVPVIRRPDRKGFKGGNLNNFLRTEDGRRLDFFVIVDSDEILPRGFVTRALDYFETDPAVGVVQANHVATRNKTRFMRTFAPGVDAHWPAYQLVKAHAGFLSFLGHGAMISRECYTAVPGGFPEIVAEDIGFSMDALREGYRVDFAPDITCEEEFPPDFAAFEKRHKKWTKGNMEFMREYSWRILVSREFKWYERLDIILFTYSLPLTGIFSLYVLMNAVLFPALGFSLHFPLWMLIPTVVSLFAPMLNDMLTWRRAPKGKLLSYLAHSFLLFGSMYFTSLFTSLKALVMGSDFNVTPKTYDEITFTAAVRQNAHKLMGGTVLAVAVQLAAGSILPVVLLLVPVAFSLYLSVMNDGQAEHEDGIHMLLPRKEQ